MHPAVGRCLIWNWSIASGHTVWDKIIPMKWAKLNIDKVMQYFLLSVWMLCVLSKSHFPNLVEKVVRYSWYLTKFSTMSLWLYSTHNLLSVSETLFTGFICIWCQNRPKNSSLRRKNVSCNHQQFYIRG